MGEYSEVFVAFDVAKRKHAEAGRKGEVRFPGEVEYTRTTIERVIKKLAGPARPTAYLLRSGSYRL
jgi:hypothetical protein